jgi:uncharacterized protein (TIGR00299 family) protein
MMLGAMIDAGLDLGDLKRELAKLPVRGYRLTARRIRKGAIACTKVDVHIPHSHHHTKASDILKMIRRSRLSVKERAIRIFTVLAESEGKIHGISPDRVEFHEVGAIDSIVDIVGTCVGLELLGIETLFCSRVPITRGTVHCQHGLLPLPGPATLDLLKGFPTTYVDLDRELVTPTGASILKALTSRAGWMPPMTLGAVGYGAGDQEIEGRPNVLRIMIGEEARGESDLIWQVDTNLDDTSGEEVGYLFEKLFEAGALDVYTTPIQMKKSRPAIKLSVLVSPDRLVRIEQVLRGSSDASGAIQIASRYRHCSHTLWTDSGQARGAQRRAFEILTGIRGHGGRCAEGGRFAASR